MPTAKPKPEEEAPQDDPEDDQEEPEDDQEEPEEESSEDDETESAPEPEPPWALTKDEWEWMKTQVSQANKKKETPPSKPKKEAPKSDGSVVVRAEATPEQKKPLTRRERRQGKKIARRGQA